MISTQSTQMESTIPSQIGGGGVRLALLAPKSAKSREIPREFEFIAGQGHPRSSILCQSKAHMGGPVRISNLVI